MPDPHSFPRQVRIHAPGFARWLAVLALLGAIPPRGVAAEENPELLGTAKMLSAHGPLTRGDLANPDSDLNRAVIESLLRATFAHRGGLPGHPVAALSNEASLPGTLPGEFSVNNRGAASYVISLPLPPSRPGPRPSSSISYLSSAGHGTMGECFYFGRGHHGSITRGRSLLARDDEARGPEVGDRDFFYLDGKRLLCVSEPSTQGRPGSRYRTEVDSFATIEAQGSGEMIEAFVLRDKDGDTYTFGRVGDEQDGMQRLYDETTGTLDPVPAEYALKRAEDRSGNYFTLAYEHKGYGEWVLTEMNYTGSREAPPPFKVRLAYEAQPTRAVVYQAQRRRDASQILVGIRVFLDDGVEPVAEYLPHYAPLGSDGIHRLESISCSISPAPGAPRQPLPATRFRWESGPDPAQRWGTLSPPAAPPPGALTILADMNGDGRPDQVTLGESVTVRLSTASGFSPKDEVWLDKAAFPAELLRTGHGTVQSGDFDGDGRADLLCVSAGGKVVSWRSDGNRLVPFASLELGPMPQAGDRVRVGDFNGDGRSDFLWHGPGNQLVQYLSRGDGFDTKGISTGPTRPQKGRILAGATMDMNGDGNDDYLWIARDDPLPAETAGAPFALCCAIARPEGGFDPAIVWQRWDRRPALWCGDFNGDDLPDFLVAQDDAPASASGAVQWSVLLNRGRPPGDSSPLERTSRRVTLASPPWADAARGATFPGLPAGAPDAILGTPGGLLMATPGDLQCLDVNGDGLDDLVWRPEPGASSWTASLAVGDGSFGAALPLTGGAWAAIARLAPREAGATLRLSRRHDLNGDGLSEWAVFRRQAGQEEQLVMAVDGAGDRPGEYPSDRVVTGIVNGLGRTLDIAYRAAKDDRVYLPGAPVPHPIRDLRSSQPVVSDIWHDTGGRGYSQFSYHYAGNRLDFSGRGGLGFAAFTTYDHQTGFCKIQFLAQGFPMTGLTLRDQTVRMFAGDNFVAVENISVSDHTVSYDAVVDPASGRPYGTVFPFTSRKRVARWANDGEYSYRFSNTGGSRTPAPSWFGAKPRVDPTWVAQEQHWFDLQAQAQPAVATVPTLTVPTVLATPGHRPPATKRPLDSLPRQITYGNETAVITRHRFGFYENEVTSYLPPPSPDDTLAGLVDTVTHSSYLSKKDGPVHDPVTTRRYFAHTALLESERLQYRDQDGKLTGQEKQTRMERDEAGRLLARYETESTPGPAANPPEGEKLKYWAADFDPITGQPEREVDIEDGDQRFEYNPLLRKASLVTFDNGTRAQLTHDGFGRAVKIHYLDSGTVVQTDYAWTPPGGADWRQRQLVPPPAGAPGISGQSVYAVRKTHTGAETTIDYHDRMDRVIRAVTLGPEGKATLVDTVFDELDRVVAQSDSYAEGSTIKWHLKSYDVYGVELEPKEVVASP